MKRTRVTDEEIVRAYQETGSVWKAGKQLGIAGQGVWDRLRLLGHRLRREKWTEEEYAELRQMAGNCTIGEIATRLGRPYAGVAAKMSRLGLANNYGNRTRDRKLPRGAGFDKATTLRRMTELERFDGGVRMYCRANGIDIESFVQAVQRYALERWTEYTKARSDLGEAKCPYCGRTFYPLSKKQRNCTRLCRTREREDLSYFGGKRRLTVGLAEGKCQLCRRDIHRGLSSHHVFGKENDPENNSLIALCQGCHKAVGLLATRAFTENEEAWQDLIHLTLMRRHAKRYLDAEKPIEVWVCVDIEQRELDEDEVAELQAEAFDRELAEDTEVPL
jgi:hypothetical protein